MRRRAEARAQARAGTEIVRSGSGGSEVDEGLAARGRGRKGPGERGATDGRRIREAANRLGKGGAGVASMTDGLAAGVAMAGLPVHMDPGMICRQVRRRVGRDRVGQRRAKRNMRGEASIDRVAEAEDHKAKGDRHPRAKAPGAKRHRLRQNVHSATHQWKRPTLSRPPGATKPRAYARAEPKATLPSPCATTSRPGPIETRKTPATPRTLWSDPGALRAHRGGHGQ